MHHFVFLVKTCAAAAAAASQLMRALGVTWKSEYLAGFFFRRGGGLVLFLS